RAVRLELKSVVKCPAVRRQQVNLSVHGAHRADFLLELRHVDIGRHLDRLHLRNLAADAREHVGLVIERIVRRVLEQHDRQIRQRLGDRAHLVNAEFRMAVGVPSEQRRRAEHDRVRARLASLTTSSFSERVKSSPSPAWPLHTMPETPFSLKSIYSRSSSSKRIDFPSGVNGTMLAQ